MLNIGEKAPNFKLQDKDGNTVSLSDFIGKKVVLYFYPKDNTPGCTRQACAFAAAYDAFKQDNIAVIGVSKDNAALLAAVNLAVKAALEDGSMAQFVAEANELSTGDTYEGLLNNGAVPEE